MENTKWVSAWCNATSILTRQVENYTKDLTLRYPVMMAFTGNKLRFTFSNYCGNEPITITGATVAISDGKCDVCGIQMPTESDSEPVNKDTFRCKMCKTYEEHKDIPVIGWFYTIVHYFVHLAHYIGSLT